jgi:hypothetical protein
LRWPSWFDDARVAGIDESSWQGIVWDFASDSSQQIDLPSDYQYGVASGHGTVAFAWAIDNDWPATHYNYAVWDGASLTAPREGFPASWSPDGSSLAVTHAFPPNRDGGWVSVVSWPGQDVQFSDAAPFATYDVHFDPSVQYIAFDTYTTNRPGKFLTRLVNLRDATTVDIDRPNASGGFAYWNADSQLAVIEPQTTIHLYSLDGKLLSTYSAPYPIAVGTSDGSTVAFFANEPPESDICVRSDGTGHCFNAPADIDHVSLAPDGSAVAVDDGRLGVYLRDV